MDQDSAFLSLLMNYSFKKFDIKLYCSTVLSPVTTG